LRLLARPDGTGGVNVSLFCKLDGKLSRWDAGKTTIDQLPQLFKDVRGEVRHHRGKIGPILALITPVVVEKKSTWPFLVPVDNTQT
jgi:hypothetical protein